MAFERISGLIARLITRSAEPGQTLVEYSLIIALIAVAAIVGVSLMAGGVGSLWGWIGDEVGNVVVNALT